MACPHIQNTRIKIAFKIENGMLETQESKITRNSRQISSTQTGDDIQHCFPLPTAFTLMLSFVLLEIVRIIYVMDKEYKKKMAIPIRAVGISVTARHDGLREHPFFQWAESYSASSCKDVTNSCPIFGVKDVPGDRLIQENQEGSNVETNDVIVNSSFILDIIKKHCLKTADFITVFILFGLGSVALYLIFSSTRWTFSSYLPMS